MSLDVLVPGGPNQMPSPEDLPEAQLWLAANQFYNGGMQQSFALPGMATEGNGFSFQAGKRGRWIPDDLAPKITVERQSDGKLVLTSEEGTYIPRRAPYGIYDSTITTVTLGEFGQMPTVATNVVRRELLIMGTCSADEVRTYPEIGRTPVRPEGEFTAADFAYWTPRLRALDEIGRRNAADALQVQRGIRLGDALRLTGLVK